MRFATYLPSLLTPKRTVQSKQISECCGPSDVFRYIVSSRLVDVCCNVFVALRIVLSIRVIVASAEGSFSKLKIIKKTICALQ